MRLSSCISLDLLYIHNGDEPSEKKNESQHCACNACPVSFTYRSADCMTHSVVPAIKRQRIDTPERSCQVLRVSVTGHPLCQLTLMEMYA